MAIANSPLCLAIQVLILFFVCELSARDVNDPLYKESDPVWILNNDTFTLTLESNPDVIWLVQFFNSYCGHCRAFAPDFRKLAGSVLDWGKWVQLAVIDCAEDTNLDICMEFEVSIMTNLMKATFLSSTELCLDSTAAICILVRSYPTLKFFVPRRNQSDIGLRMEGSRTVSNIKKKILELVSGIDEDIAQRLQPISAAEIPGRLAEKFALQIFVLEKEDSLVGREIIIDFVPVQDIQIHRLIDSEESGVRTTASQLWALDPAMFEKNEAVVVVLRDAEVVGTKWILDRETADVKKFIIEIAKGFVNITAMEEGGNALRMKVAVALEKENKEAEIDSAVEGRDEREPINVQGVKPEIAQENLNDKVYFVDMEKALSYLLRHEVALSKEISGERLSALVEFVSVVRDQLPLRLPVQNFLESLLRFLKNPHQKSIQGKEWKDLVESLGSRGFDQFLPDYESYKACQGSAPGFRGYPCGLWTIFHSITVNAALRSDFINSEPLRPLRAIHGYVKYFFSCEYCSKHFQAMAAKDMESSVRAPLDSPLWLWRSHNRVNKRLKGDASEDPAHPKVIYPSASLCPLCYDGSEPRTVEGSWNEEEVMMYLTNKYGSVHVDVSGTENNIVQVKPAVSWGSEQNPVGEAKAMKLQSLKKFFTSGEVTFCMLLYLASTILLVAACIVVSRKRMRFSLFRTRKSSSPGQVLPYAFRNRW
ncbi:unnamed protein product [Cyprideis torosa]|uniref:Sulfhydryl oxidase n=1 Tax=Cyprideis torosa TaxID=163714 RepID=A0A7R8W2G0_9CRUS|nr:unnamed protein product [Cyprideis torosa]CAG0881906.1 unnamed protein product [Cyprideis torosa]